MQLSIPVDAGRIGVLCCPMPAISCQPDAPAWDVDSDWWGPTWDVVTSAGPAAPGGGRSGGRAATAAVAEPPTPVSGPETPPVAAPAPSWGRIVVTTIGLWVSRRLARLAGWAPAAWAAHARLLSASMLGAGLLAAGAGTAGLVVASGSPASAVPLAARPSPVAVPSGRAAAPVWLATVRPTPRPVFLTIPAIGVRAPIINLGLNPNGTLQVPRTTTVVGWYTGSPRPGATGSAIIAGHVDSRSGPGVFFWLRTMRRGDRIYVRRAGGTLAVFTVTAVRMYHKDKFPTAAVYGPVPDAELRLITCGGTFDYSTGSYLSNVVVYARLTS
jgi:sortase (surface protein transpeptidase)